MNQIPTTAITIDPRKKRIRMFKSMLHLLEEPNYIQLLVNPEQKLFVIRAVEKEAPYAQTFKINKHIQNTDNSYELYSGTLVGKLCSILGVTDESYSYRMTGSVVLAQKMAAFSFDTLEKIEG